MTANRTKILTVLAIAALLGAGWWLLAPTQLGGRTSYAIVVGNSMEPKPRARRLRDHARPLLVRAGRRRALPRRPDGQALSPPHRSHRAGRPPRHQGRPQPVRRSLEADAARRRGRAGRDPPRSRHRHPDGSCSRSTSPFSSSSSRSSRSPVEGRCRAGVPTSSDRCSRNSHVRQPIATDGDARPAALRRCARGHRALRSPRVLAWRAPETEQTHAVRRLCAHGALGTRVARRAAPSTRTAGRDRRDGVHEARAGARRLVRLRLRDEASERMSAARSRSAPSSRTARAGNARCRSRPGTLHRHDRARRGPARGATARTARGAAARPDRRRRRDVEGGVRAACRRLGLRGIDGDRQLVRAASRTRLRRYRRSGSIASDGDLETVRSPRVEARRRAACPARSASVRSSSR